MSVPDNDRLTSHEMIVNRSVSRLYEEVRVLPGATHVVEVQQQVVQRDVTSERRHVDVLVEIGVELGVAGVGDPLEQLDHRREIVLVLLGDLAIRVGCTPADLRRDTGSARC